MEKRSVRTISTRGLPSAFFNPKPAAFVINMSGQMILQLIAAGLYIYVKGCTCETPGDICPKCFEQIKPIPF